MSLTEQHMKETICAAHIYAVAGMARVNLSARLEFDYGVDGQFHAVVRRGDHLIPSGYPLDYQAKATVDWACNGSHIVYDLDARAYNNIATRPASATTLILVLLCLSKNGLVWHELSSDQTVLRHCCYWHTFSDEGTENRSKQRVFIPKENLFTPQALAELLEAERQRRVG